MAESLGLPGLEVIETQAAVGPFYADIVAQIVGTDHKVVIENQLDKADHRHLGQVLTYAPKFDARVCVWVAAHICEEHRAAVDWLNRITGEGYAFFGVEVRAVKIGDSEPAPIFEVVSKPNDFARLVAQASYDSGEMSEATRTGLEFWPLLHSALAEAGLPTRKATKPLKDQTYWIPIAGSQAYFWIYRSYSRDPYLKVGVSFYGDAGFDVWKELFEDREQIDRTLGATCDWIENKQGTSWNIHLPSRSGAVDESDWPEQIEWAVKQIGDLNTVLGGRIRLALRPS